MPFFRLSAGRVDVQPAAELRHLQRHGHGRYVFRALLRRVPCPQPAVAPSPARCVRRGRPPPAAPRPVYLALHRLPFFRLSAGSTGVQPAAELRHVQRHKYALHAQGALLPVPCTQSAVQLSPAHWTPSPLSAGPQPRPAPYGPHFQLSAERVGVPPAAELRYLQRHGHVPDVFGALLR
eukprot:scaffold3424_cov51-Phaeocystis_antarctica.AAC.2